MATYAAFYNENLSPDGLRSALMSFRPGVTLQCEPPYRKGQVDTIWVQVKGPMPKTTNRAAIEALAGMPVLPL
jgi:hypothetical protein